MSRSRLARSLTLLPLAASLVLGGATAADGATDAGAAHGAFVSTPALSTAPLTVGHPAGGTTSGSAAAPASTSGVAHAARAARAARAAARRRALAHRRALHRAALYRAVHRQALHRAALHRAARRGHVPGKRRVTRRQTHPLPSSSTPAQAPGQVPVTGVALNAFESRMVFLVNQARAEHGLPALVTVAGATDVARRWTLRLAEADALSHNPDLATDLASAGSGNWSFIAENVGVGPVGDADGLFAAYMASEHHRDNILDPRAVEIGMGALAVSEPEGDTEWNTMDFVDRYSDSYGPARTHTWDTELSVTDAAVAQG